DDGTITEAASEITWTGGKIGAGQFEDFDVAFGQLPEDTGQLTFKTLQTYSDGKVVRWIEEAGSGGEEPENPAPTIKLTAGDDATTSTAPAAAPKSTGTSTATAAGSDSTARSLGSAGLIVGVLGLAAGGYAVVRGRPGAGPRGE
ncbi:DUF1775 domain-containing protein, partial [Streptomyces sp. NPDC004270]